MEYTFHTIYWHWSATGWDWDGYEADGSIPYNTVFQGEGQILYRLPYNVSPQATFRRNTGSVSLALACMGGTDPWNQAPPTEKQTEAMCEHTARLCRLRGWPADANWLRTRVMTHGEAASLRDFRRDQAAAFPDNGSNDGEMDARAEAASLPHSNYGPSSWWDGWPGGDGTRWDLAQLKPSDPMGIGGNVLRAKVVAYMNKQHAEAVAAGQTKPKETK